MTEQEIREISRYFRLSNYRDEGSIQLDEYEELNNIIKNNKYANDQEEARYKWLKGEISDEEYQKIYNMFDDIISDYVSKKTL